MKTKYSYEYRTPSLSLFILALNDEVAWPNLSISEEQNAIAD